MAKLTKSELARRTVRDVFVELPTYTKLSDLVQQYGADCIIECHTGWYDDPDTYYLVHERDENDEEYQKRIDDLMEFKRAEESRMRDARKKHLEDERKTYERLKKKFDKKS
jgi:hypothetical protein